MEVIATTSKSNIENPSTSNQNIEILENGASLESQVTTVTIDLEKAEEVIVLTDSEDTNVIQVPTHELSDSDDSDVVIQEPKLETTYVSSASSVESLCDDIGDMPGLLLNTTNMQRTLFPPDDGVEEVVKYNWRDVASPSSWTESMKKYYNKPSKSLRNFDYRKVVEEIKDKGTWHILPQDLYPKSGPVKRCSLCRQTDHLIRNCPKRFSNCSMCGNPGHAATACPFRMCLNCGRQNNVFVAMCSTCEANRHKVCDECNQRGHIKSQCPDTWRRYHSTTSGKLVERPDKVNEKSMCCNCGKKGHLYEDCKNLYWSIYPPTSFFAKNKTELEVNPSKRKQNNDFESPKNTKARNKKNRGGNPNSKKNHDYFDDSFQNFPRNNTRYFNMTPESTKSNTNRFNRNSRTPQNNMNRYFNYSPEPSHSNMNNYFMNDGPSNKHYHFDNAHVTPKSKKKKKKKKSKNKQNKNNSAKTPATV